MEKLFNVIFFNKFIKHKLHVYCLAIRRITNSNFYKLTYSVDQTLDEPAIEDLLKNCRKYKDELQMGENLNAAVEQYETLLKKAKATGCEVNCVA